MAPTNKWSPRYPTDRCETTPYVPVVTTVVDSPALPTIEVGKLVMTWGNDDTATSRYNSEALVTILESINGVPRFIPIEE